MSDEQLQIAIETIHQYLREEASQNKLEPSIETLFVAIAKASAHDPDFRNLLRSLWQELC